MNLQTSYLGMPLSSPVVASPSPLTRSLDNLKRMEEAGAGAVVLYSLFEEQIRHEQDAVDHYTGIGVDSFSEAADFFPVTDEDAFGPQQYLDHVHQASHSLHLPVIASLNGCTRDGWIDYARRIEEAGAKALELNVYQVAADPTVSGDEIERRTLDVVRAVRESVHIPVAVKIGPFFSSLAHFAVSLENAGADALVLFNRFYQPDIDLEHLEVSPRLHLSTPEEMRLPLRWIGLLHGRIHCELAATTGVHQAADAIKYLLAGAQVVMTTSALLKNGIPHLTTINKGIQQWMVEQEVNDINRVRGSMSVHTAGDPSAFERANYLRLLQGFEASQLDGPAS